MDMRMSVQCAIKKMEKYLNLFLCILYVSSQNSIVDAVKIVPEKTFLFSLEGDQLKLECISETNDTATFSKDGQVLDNNAGFEITTSISTDQSRRKTTLTKKATDENDRGIYTCEVTGKTSAQITVYTFKARTSSANLTFAATLVELQCNIDIAAPKGLVTYSISWEHDGKTVEENDRFIIFNNSLQIRHPSWSDIGVYQCVIIFFPGSQVEKQINRLKPSLLRAGPLIEYHDMDKTVMNGDSLELTCQVLGFPKPTIAWYKDNAKINMTARIQITEYDNATTLLNITATDAQDEGNYLCHAENPIPPFKASARMRVMIKEREVSGSMSAHGRPLQSLFLVSLSVRYLTYIFVPNLN